MSEPRKCICRGTAADEETPSEKAWEDYSVIQRSIDREQGAAADEATPREDTAAPESEPDLPGTGGLSLEQMREYQRGLLLSGVLENAEELRVTRNTLFDKGTPSHNQIQTDILFNIQALLVFLVERS